MIEKKKSKLFIYFRKLLMGLSLIIGLIGISNIKTNAFDYGYYPETDTLVNAFSDYNVSFDLVNCNYLLNSNTSAYYPNIDTLLSGLDKQITYEVNQMYFTQDLTMVDTDVNSIERLNDDKPGYYEILNTFSTIELGGLNVYYYEPFMLEIFEELEWTYEVYPSLSWYFESSQGFSYNDLNINSFITFDFSYVDRVTRLLVSNEMRLSNVIVIEDENLFGVNIMESIYNSVRNYIIDNQYDNDFINAIGNDFVISNLRFDLNISNGTLQPDSFFNNVFLDESYLKPSTILTIDNYIADSIDISFSDWINTSVGGFLEFQIVPGISIMELFTIIMALAILVVIIKFFSGH